MSDRHGREGQRQKAKAHFAPPLDEESKLPGNPLSHTAGTLLPQMSQSSFDGTNSLLHIPSKQELDDISELSSMQSSRQTNFLGSTDRFNSTAQTFKERGNANSSTSHRVYKRK